VNKKMQKSGKNNNIFFYPNFYKLLYLSEGLKNNSMFAFETLYYSI
jgi:hypothetical protein